MRKTYPFVLASMTSLLACGSSTNTAPKEVLDPGSHSTSNTNSGTVEGINLEIHSAASKAGDGNSALRLVLSNAPDYCVASSTNQLPKNHVTFSASLYGKKDDQNRLVTPPGTYTMVYDQPPTVDSFAATGNFDASDAQCKPRLEDTLTEAESGTVTLTEVSDEGVKGTYKVRFKGGTLEGTFNAPACPTSDMIGGELCTP